MSTIGVPLKGFSAALVLSCTLLAAAGWIGQGGQFDAARLQETEELSEELANRLLDFSLTVRDRDWEGMRGFFAPLVGTAPFPVVATELAGGDRIGRWISTCDITPETGAVSLPVEAALTRWRRFLDTFSSIEDARWKVVKAGFETRDEVVRAESGFKFFLVGRDAARRRLWVKGSGKLLAHKNLEWRFDSLALTHVEIQRADIDLFSEVGLPAGVSVPLPRYGAPGNNDFIYHGAAVGDLDKDGLTDIVATGISGISLYRNRGDGTFDEISWAAGLPPLSRTTAPLLLDIDNDGDQDLFLAAVGAQVLFENISPPKGPLQFVDISIESGVALAADGFGATAGDVNGDGLPDIYVSSYNRYGRVTPNSWYRATNGTPNLLFINQGGGRFKEQGRAWRVDDGRWSYSSQFVDVNGDSRLDLYVVNDFGDNGLFVNRGNRFEDATKAFGLIDTGNGMGVSFGDFNNDARLDVFVTNMSSTAGNRILERLFPDASGGGVLRKLAAGNMLYAGQADGTFRNVSDEVGPFQGGWAWGGVLADLDNDGWQDAYAASGFVSGKSMADT